jgi:hypothetical protein
MEVLQRTANRGSVSTGPYEIDNSCKYQNPERMQLANATIGTPTSTQIATLSFWVKRTRLQPSGNHIVWIGNAGGVSTFAGFNDDCLRWISDVSNAGIFKSNAVFRDCSAWYHIVWAFDTTQGTEADRVKAYVNGVQVTSWSTATYPNQNNVIGIYETNMNHWLGWEDAQCQEGYYTEVYLIDGQQLAPTAFGEFDSDTGIWIPKAYTGTFGDAGYHIDMEDSSALGADVSGNSNNFSLYGIDSTNQATDTPTNNFCTLNPLVNFKYGTNAGGMTDGATVFGDDTGGGVGGAFGTFGVTAGKWYWEMKLTQQVAHYPGISAVDDGDNVYASSDPQEINSTFNYNISAARREYVNGGSLTYGSLDEMSDFHSAGDIIGIALNMDDNQISIYGNGTLQSGIANSSIFDAANKMCVPFHGTINDEVQYNFGGYSVWTPSSVANDENGYGSFEYAPPSGYYALCTKNLSEFGG